MQAFRTWHGAFVMIQTQFGTKMLWELDRSINLNMSPYKPIKTILLSNLKMQNTNMWKLSDLTIGENSMSELIMILQEPDLSNQGGTVLSGDLWA